MFRHASPQEYHPRWKSWRIEDLPMLPEPRFRPRTGCAAKIQECKSAIAQADRIILAPPPDPPGMMDLQILLDYVGYVGPVTVWSTHSLRDQDMIRTISSPVEDADYWVQAEKLRVHADWLIGLNGSRAMTLYGRVSKAIPVGRVLSAMLSTFPVVPLSPSTEDQNSSLDASTLQARTLRAFGDAPKDTLVAWQRAWEMGRISYPFSNEPVRFLEKLSAPPSDPLYALFQGAGRRENHPPCLLADWLESLRDVSPWVQDPALKSQGSNIPLGSVRGRVNHFQHLVDQGWLDPHEMRLTDAGRRVHAQLPASLTDLGLTVLWSHALDPRVSIGKIGEGSDVLQKFRAWSDKYVVDLISQMGKG
ncbi:hypothetical protein B1757_02855 [Acidithiobacillus marinus]|uniref:Uncharacterized protein n=1 Tax=Acidithiobacillus marinus TaxID=187490 RepID=A0A2I1DPF3_9PROT|nr:hypothetical protein [Acidithiobacillus marinus]PKY11747.1 hypothetical protein B1757_02855 [Acidithiobacillus marinus]